MIKSFVKSRSSTSIPVIREKNPFLSVQYALDRAIDDFYKIFQTPSTFEEWENLTITPSIDILDEEKMFKLEAEVPGMGPEDLKVSISDGVLTIMGEKTKSTQDNGKNYQSREITYGCYQRAIPLPDSVDTEKAKATFKKGMLWIEIPKKEGTQKSRKDIKVEEVKNH